MSGRDDYGFGDIYPDEVEDFLADEPTASSIYWHDGPLDSERAGWRRMCRAVIAQAFLDACFRAGEDLPDRRPRSEWDRDHEPLAIERSQARQWLTGGIWRESLEFFCFHSGLHINKTIAAAKDLEGRGWVMNG